MAELQVGGRAGHSGEELLTLAPLHEGLEAASSRWESLSPRTQVTTPPWLVLGSEDSTAVTL